MNSDTEISKEIRQGATVLLDNDRVIRDLPVDMLLALRAIEKNDTAHLRSNYIRPESVVLSLRRSYKL